MLQHVFISSAHDDDYFVGLLKMLLTIHGMDAWRSKERIRGGDEWRTQIEHAVQAADALIAVVSEHSAQSTWVRTEFALYRAAKPSGRVLPIRLDATAVELIDAELQRFHAVDFSQDMLDGCFKLFDGLGVEFLAEGAILLPNRRKAGSDRRTGPTIQRLRIGFWKAFHADTGKSKFEREIVGIALHKIASLLKSGEALRYRYVDADSGIEVPAAIALDAAEQIVYADFTEQSGRHKFDTSDGVPVIYLVEGLASALDKLYAVTALDRRATDALSELRRERG